MKSEHSESKAIGDKFYCPMKCEVEKTYIKSGDCPVCNMKLQTVVSMIELLISF